MKKEFLASMMFLASILPASAADFSVLGEVKNPGNYNFDEDHNIYDGLAKAGGFSDVAARKEVRISRKIDSAKRQVFYINFREDLITTEEGDKISIDGPDYMLQDGDIVYVKASRVRQFTHFMMAIIKAVSGAAIAGAVAGVVS
jgi:protein involved in polysaccharide export with SLBB domain